jgi:hypothetical protein
MFDWRPRPCPGSRREVGRQTGGEIPPARAYHRVEKWMCGLQLGLIFLMLVAPPLRPGVVGPYSIRDVWFPIHLPVEGTHSIQNFGP